MPVTASSSNQRSRLPSHRPRSHPCSNFESDVSEPIPSGGNASALRHCPGPMVAARSSMLPAIEDWPPAMRERCMSGRDAATICMHTTAPAQRLLRKIGSMNIPMHPHRELSRRSDAGHATAHAEDWQGGLLSDHSTKSEQALRRRSCSGGHVRFGDSMWTVAQCQSWNALL